jgi:hypothetical protein
MRVVPLAQVLFAPLAVSMYSSLASQHMLKLPAGAAPQLLPAASFSAAPAWLPVRPSPLSILQCTCGRLPADCSSFTAGQQRLIVF